MQQSTSSNQTNITAIDDEYHKMIRQGRQRRAAPTRSPQGANPGSNRISTTLNTHADMPQRFSLTATSPP